jgi:uncharacterized protein YeaO (DUF488 family)
MWAGSSKKKDWQEFRSHYGEEMDQALETPNTEVVCHQRYTLRERIAKLLGAKFTPTNPRLSVTFYNNGVGFVVTSAPEN